MNKLYNDTAVQAIANAIRAKNGSSDTYTIAEMSTALNDLSYYAKPTISNVALATFEADGLPLNKLKVAINAVQDLHGYDHPWVGGAGKNKLDSSHGVLHQYTSDATALRWGYEPITLKAGTYTVSYVKNGNYVLYLVYTDTWESVDLSPNGTSFTISEQREIFIRSALSSGNTEATFLAQFSNVQLEQGNQATSFEPYSNICPISGWDEANVSDVDDVDNPTVTQTTTIALPQTVYGGELDVVNGTSGNKLTHGIRQGFTRGALDSSGKLYKLTPILDDAAVWTDAANASTKIMSNMFEVLSLRDARTATTPSISQYDTGLYVGGYVGDEATLDALLSDLQIKYELATPTTFTTQPTPIKSLNGQNNISVDCGEVIELEYFKEV